MNFRVYIYLGRGREISSSRGVLSLRILYIHKNYTSLLFAKHGFTENDIKYGALPDSHMNKH